VGPTYGFAIDSNDTLTYSGSSVFYACPASDTEWNLYTTPVIGQLKCVEISLTASGCGATSSATQSVSYVTVSASPTVSTVVSTVIVYACGTEPTTSELATSTPPITTSAPAGTQPTTTTVESSKTIVVIPTSSPETVESTSTSTSTQPIVTQTTSPHTYVSAPTTSASPLNSSKQANSTTWITIKTASTFSVVTTTAKTTSSFYWSNSTSVATSAVAPSSSSTSASSSCATTLSGSNTSGNYQWPHLIVPISSSSPDTAAGTSYFGTISPNTSTIFNFDIPSSYADHTCSLIFLLPLQSQLETSSYTYSPTGAIDFEQLSSPALTSTTWDNAPAVSSNLGEFSIAEGSSTLVSTFACPAGETVAYEAKAVGDTNLYYFQDWNPSPIGLYITYC
jgi:hypothetical protein